MLPPIVNNFDKREWTLIAEGGVWRVLNGAGSPYMLGEKVMTVSKGRAVAAEIDRGRYKAALHQIDGLCIEEHDLLACLQRIREIVTNVL
jgi:hypothetical protein